MKEKSNAAFEWQARRISVAQPLGTDESLRLTQDNSVRTSAVCSRSGRMSTLSAVDDAELAAYQSGSR